MIACAVGLLRAIAIDAHSFPRVLRRLPCTPHPNAATGILLRRAGQIVRFARSNILLYDKHVIDLSHRICALYRMGEDIETREKPNSNLAVSTPHKKASHETGFVLRKK